MSQRAGQWSALDGFRLARVFQGDLEPKKMLGH